MYIKKLLGLLLCASLMISGPAVAAPIASAETVPMTWKPMDKAYITLIVDDNNASLQQMVDIVTKEYGFPLCVAVPVESYDKTLNTAAHPDSLDLLHEIENRGGEILSHNLTHKVFNRDVDWDTVDYELGESYRRLTAEGFNVNGVIGCGGGGSEDNSEEYRAELEQYTRKYYHYSDCYGVSTQYYKTRNWIAAGWNSTQGIIDNAITQNSWEILAWHHFPDVFDTNLTETDLRTILDYLKEKQDEGVLEVVTYRDVHKSFADWETPVDLGDTKYTVDFYSTDDKTLLTSVTVAEGESATAPELEVAGGVKFKGWSGSLDNVTGNTRVYAKCVYDNGSAVELTDAPAVRLKPTEATTTTSTTTTTTETPSTTTTTTATTTATTTTTTATTTTTTTTVKPTTTTTTAAPSTTTTTTVPDSSEPSAPESAEPESDLPEDDPVEAPIASDTEQPPVKKKSALPFILLGACAIVAAAAVVVVLIRNKK